MTVFQCAVCDPDDPCVLPRAGQLAEYPDTCPWSKEKNRAVWRELVVGGEGKPGCFGAIGLPGKLNDPLCPCGWRSRCKQSQVDS